MFNKTSTTKFGLTFVYIVVLGLLSKHEVLHQNNLNTCNAICSCYNGFMFILM